MDIEFFLFLFFALSFLITIATTFGSLYQRIFKGVSWSIALAKPFGERGSSDTEDSESADQETISQRKKRLAIVALVIFNLLFFYCIYVYVLPY